jgi:hypothetical protein
MVCCSFIPLKEKFYHFIEFALDDYLALVDWTGRLVHPKKK